MAVTLEDIYEDHETFNDKQRNKIKKAAKGQLVDLQSLISSYADKDGKIDRRRMNKLIRDLDGIERGLRDELMGSLEDFTDETSEWSAKKLAGVFGITASAAYLSRIRKQVRKDVISRKGTDGLRLKDRVRTVSGNIQDEVTKVIRQSVTRGVSATEIINKVREKYEKELWKVDRITRTEGHTAFRSAVMENSRTEDGNPGWVLFHEGTCGRPDHHTHNCYDLQRENRHGMGNGIFKTSDKDILTPHPNCTSWITLLDEEGRDR